ncbi:hypothetical protein BCR32DRAFT_267836 [Anaeromyces robustus]|uniref:Xylanolytic transcriptional activator regulatory domain-containing protein n=1 Tax=Anaeromyces robustus TaxID=1754192 RepID=A0A1Y1X9W0_9FUNG|nr:hypothetical protein BCR32DRAFT_267836 [Anaeromyces robustus]|eukprot:ORX82134.1 hypothetical protein BCR32DRAFT_267836 [Anaeromyces robustus]
MDLIKIYFTHINHNIPFIKKADFLQKLNNQPTFLLISLYTVTSMLDPIINKKGNSFENTIYSIDPTESERYFDFAYKLMPLNINEPKISTIQALLILSFFSILSNKLSFSRMYINVATQMLFSMRFQYDSLKNTQEALNLKIKPILNIQRRLWYCTYILHVFSLLSSNMPIASFIDSYLVPFPDDDENFNEEISLPHQIKNDYMNRNSLNNYNYELDKKNFPMTSSFSFNENMNMNKDYPSSSSNMNEINNLIIDFAENEDVKMCSEVPVGYMKELITLTRLTAENFCLVNDRELNSLIHYQSEKKREIVEKAFLLNTELERNKKYKSKAKEYDINKISSGSNPYDYNPCCCFDINAFSKLIILDYNFQDWLKYLDEKFKEIPSPVTPENFTVFRSTSNLHMLWNWNQMHLHRPLYCTCDRKNSNISSLLSTYLMLNPLLDHFNPLFIEAVYESAINHIMVLLYPPEDYPEEKLRHIFKLIKLNILVITKLSNIWPYARKYKDSLENLITSSDIYSTYSKN